MVQPADERAHEPGPEAGWQEAWDFDFVGDGLAGYLRFAVVPAERAAWCWVAVVGDVVDQRLIAVRDHDLAAPRSWPMEVRGDGLWCGLFCESPLEHWTVGLEAFGVGYDDPFRAWGDERGDLVPLGFDLEWEDLSEDEGVTSSGGYRRRCEVSGEVLIGSASFDVTATGSRAHEWGVPDWTSTAGDTSFLAVELAPVLVPPHRVLRGLVPSADRNGSARAEWREWRGAAATAMAEAVERTA